MLSFDSTRGITVLYSAGNTATTWEWNGISWSLVSTGEPPFCGDHGEAFDEAADNTVLFGGDSGVFRLDHTWTWNGNSWTEHLVSGPSARSQIAMTYDSARSQTVLFGGYVGFSGPAGDTWLWNGAAWSEVAVAGPAARSDHMMAFDSSRGIAFLHGGSNVTTSELFEDTWTWDGAAWNQLQSAHYPPARSSHAMVFDSASDRIVLFGGRRFDSGEIYGDLGCWYRQQHHPLCLLNNRSSRAGRSLLT